MTRATVALLGLVALLVSLACSGQGSGTATGDLFLVADQTGLNLYDLNANKTSPLLPYNDGSYILFPAVSPDGKRIAFIRQPPAGLKPDGSLDFGSDLYLVDRDGKNAHELVHHAALAESIETPAWLSNDELLFSVRTTLPNGDADLRIEKLNLTTGARARFLENAVDAAISPDGKYIAYDRFDQDEQTEELVVATRDLSQSQTVVDRTRNLALFGSIVFSPDSSQVAFAAIDLSPPPVTPGSSADPDPTRLQASSLRHPFAQDVWLVGRDGANLHRVSDLAQNMPSISFADSKTMFVLGPTGFWRIDLPSSTLQQLTGGLIGQMVWLAR